MSRHISDDWKWPLESAHDVLTQSHGTSGIYYTGCSQNDYYNGPGVSFFFACVCVCETICSETDTTAYTNRGSLVSHHQLYKWRSTQRTDVSD